MYRPSVVTRLSILIAVLAIALASWRIAQPMTGLLVERSHLGTIPITTFKRHAGKPAAIVVLAHGFAGSQQMMQPLAVSLANHGYTAITFDFPGHGRNATPLAGGRGDKAESGHALLTTLEAVVRAARTSAGATPVVLIGHSMASDIVVRQAARDPGIAATIALSLFTRDATGPRNLLIIDGAWEPAMLHEFGRAALVPLAGAGAREGVTYGDLAQGTARRFVLARGAEHIGVLYARDTLTETLAWLAALTGNQNIGSVDRRGPWLGLLYGGIVLLAWPLSRLLPRLRTDPPPSPPSWSRLLAIAGLPALATPLLLRWLPTDLLPLLVGGYLALHFAVYGALMLALQHWLAPAAPTVRPRVVPFLAATVAASLFCLMAIALPTDLLVTNYRLGDGRVGSFLALFAGLLLYFAADEALVRGVPARRGAGIVTGALLLASLGLAVALDPYRLFFLLIILPAMLAYLVVYGLFGRWIFERTHVPLVGAVAVALSIAWGVAATFPISAG